MEDGVLRRSVLGGSAGALTMATASASKAAFGRGLDPADPLQRARVRAKLIGSAGEETVYTLFRLNLYGYLNDGALLPFSL